MCPTVVGLSVARGVCWGGERRGRERGEAIWGRWAQYGRFCPLASHNAAADITFKWCFQTRLGPSHQKRMKEIKEMVLLLNNLRDDINTLKCTSNTPTSDQLSLSSCHHAKESTILLVIFTCFLKLSFFKVTLLVVLLSVISCGFPWGQSLSQDSHQGSPGKCQRCQKSETRKNHQMAKCLTTSTLG